MEDEVEELELSINELSQTEVQVSDANTNTALSEGNHDARPRPDNLEQEKRNVIYDIEEWRIRKESKEKTEAVDKIKQFKIRISSLEKERNSQIFNKKNEFQKEFCELEELELKLTANRKEERGTINSRLQKISSNVAKFKKEIDTPRNNAVFVDRLKVLMEDIESSMMKYKQEQGTIYEEMMKLEKQFALDIESSQKKIESWTGSNAVVSLSKKTKLEEDKKNLSAPPEVKAFEKFLLQTGGHYGGWDEYDHQEFLKLKKKHKSFNNFLTAAESDIPTRNRNDIILHNDWYREYQLLREHKRTAIAKWKDMKQSERQELLQKVEDDSSSVRQKDLIKQQIFEREKQERFSKLEKWKLDKEMNHRETLERENQIRNEERIRKDEEEQRRRDEARLKVENYHKQKQEEERILALARKARLDEEKSAKKITQEEKDRIKERDMRLLKERTRRMQLKEIEKKEKEKRLNKLKSQVEVNVERDPSRLYRLTEGWKERKKNAKPDNSGPMLSFQHRAVPAWRKGP